MSADLFAGVDAESISGDSARAGPRGIASVRTLVAQIISDDGLTLVTIAAFVLITLVLQRITAWLSP